MKAQMIEEVWKDIEGFEGFYQISNLGRIKSIAVRRSLWGKIHIINRERLMTPYDNGNGYLMISLTANKKRTPIAIHRLVASAFLEKPEGHDVVNHKDYDTHNNSADNLEWCTQKYNTNYSSSRMAKPKTKCRSTSTGEKYICFHQGKYRVQINKLKISKRFESLDDAIAFRDSVIAENEWYFRKGVV